jgi:hypothetical protein
MKVFARFFQKAPLPSFTFWIGLSSDKGRA